MYSGISVIQILLFTKLQISVSEHCYPNVCETKPAEKCIRAIVVN